MSPTLRRRTSTAAWILACVLGPAIFLPICFRHICGDDFLPFYAAARQVPHHGIYSAEAIYRTEIAAAGGYRPSLLFVRLPVFALLLWPLAQLPYEWAYAVWSALRSCALVGFILAWPHTPRRSTALACAWFVPLFITLARGQDTVLLLFWIAVAECLAPRRPFAAGLALAMCAAKFNLFLLLPLFLWVHRRRLIPGFLAGGAGLLALSFASAGWRWPLAYLAVLRNPVIRTNHPVNFHYMPLPGPVAMALAALTALAAVYAIVRLGDRMALGVMLVGGLLLSYHAGVYDLVLLLPAALALPGRLRATYAAAAAPAPA
jgi:hypothetical protein